MIVKNETADEGLRINLFFLRGRTRKCDEKKVKEF